MNYTISELIWLLLVYSFFGWIIETVVGTIKNHKFINRGFSTGPFCLVYGAAAVLMTVILKDLIGNPVFLFIGCGIIATVVEWFTGKFLERLNSHKWWDYSGKKWNFDGYICLQYSVLWAILGAVSIRYINELLLLFYQIMPQPFFRIFIWFLAVLITLDMALSIAAALHIKKAGPAPEAAIRAKRKAAVLTYKFGISIVGYV